MSVSIKVDEDLSAEIASRLCVAGHDATTVYQQGHSGKRHDLLWPIVQNEQRLLFTADKGFANARDYPRGSHAGVVLFRLPRESRAGYIRLVDFLLEELNLDDIKGAIVVVSPDAIRILRP
jgi:hypothetical protein